MQRGICQALLCTSSPVKVKVIFSLQIMALVVEVCLGGLSWWSILVVHIKVVSNGHIRINHWLHFSTSNSVCYINMSSPDHLMLHLYVMSVHHLSMSCQCVKSVSPIHQIWKYSNFWFCWIVLHQKSVWFTTYFKLKINNDYLNND